MDARQRVAALPKHEQRGSRLRCILFTEGPAAKVAARFASLTRIKDSAPLAVVDPEKHQWLPRGFERTEEAELGKTAEILSPAHSQTMRKWWLIHSRDARLPRWDLASQATIEGREGLILVEAKAHDRELDTAGKQPGGAINHERIRVAIAEANEALNRLCPGWALSRDAHYQMVNRFCWAWKLASIGVPVILVFLGFVQALEMRDLGAPIPDRAAWENLVMAHSAEMVPSAAWNQRFLVEGAPFRALIQAMTWTIPPRS